MIKLLGQESKLKEEYSSEATKNSKKAKNLEKHLKSIEDQYKMKKMQEEAMKRKMGSGAPRTSTKR